MTGSFADTTVLVEIAENLSGIQTEIRTHLDKNPPGQVPDYALREFLSGRLQILCTAHNKLLASSSVPEAIAAFAKVGGFSARSTFAKIAELAGALDAVMKSKTSVTEEEAKREVTEYLALAAAKRWIKAKRPSPLQYIQPLSCLNRGDLSFDAAGAITGPSGTFSCLANERCAAAQYIHGKSNELAKLIETLHPDKLPPSLVDKVENRSRRKALKELARTGPTKFNKSMCRSLGDAYFAIMCPPSSRVLTTNLVDHQLLCAALGKTAQKP